MQIAELFDHCQRSVALHWVAGRNADQPIVIADGEALAVVPFSPWRAAPLVLLGEAELAGLNTTELRARLFHAGAAVVILARTAQAPEWMAAGADQAGVALWRSPLSVSRLQQQLTPLLLQVFAPRCQLHGVLLRVGGVGTLLLGEPGVGKGSLALTLLGRGHSLVTDDVVSLVRTGDGRLVGSNPGRLAGYLFVRGLGVVDAVRDFGAMALAFDTPVEQLIALRGAGDAPAADAEGMSAETELSGETFRQEWLGVALEGLIVRGNCGAADRVEAYTRRRLLAKRGHRVTDEFCSRQRDA